jgi:predicted outer membrane protein
VALLPALSQAQTAPPQPGIQVRPDAPRAVPQAAPQAGQGQQAGAVTEQLAAWLALIDYSEVELGQLAQKQAKDPAVQKFAERMVSEHTMHLKKLQQFMPTLGRPGQPGPQERTAAKVTPEGRIPQEGRTDPAGGQPQARARGAHSTMVQVGSQASQRALQMTKEMLSKQQGRDFDMGYMAQQVVAHTYAVATLEAMQGKGSPEFQKNVEAGLKATRDHLEMAQQIAKKLNREEEVDSNPQQ